MCNVKLKYLYFCDHINCNVLISKFVKTTFCSPLDINVKKNLEKHSLINVMFLAI